MGRSQTVLVGLLVGIGGVLSKDEAFTNNRYAYISVSINV
jgi:hypothetical protein